MYSRLVRSLYFFFSFKIRTYMILKVHKCCHLDVQRQCQFVSYDEPFMGGAVSKFSWPPLGVGVGADEVLILNFGCGKGGMRGEHVAVTRGLPWVHNCDPLNCSSWALRFHPLTSFFINVLEGSVMRVGVGILAGGVVAQTFSEFLS